MILASIPSPSTNAIELGPLEIHFYGILIATGALVAATVVRAIVANRGGDPALADRAAVWAIVAGILGARTGYVLTHLGDVAEDPLSAFAIWEGGLAFFGGLTAGTLAVVYLLRKEGADLGLFADAAAIAVPIAQAIGRWGNYFNQELYGTPTDLPWALEIDPQNRVAEYPLADTFHPTFLYESLANLVLAFTLWRLLQADRLRRGSLGFCYLLGYGVIRFGTELIRTDTTWRLLGLSRNGWLSLLAVVVGAAGLWWWNKRTTRTGEPAVDLGSAESARDTEETGAGPNGDSEESQTR